jgi:sec-independent protein translocase protein TatA
MFFRRIVDYACGCDWRYSVGGSKVFSVGPWEAVLILLVVLIVFGAGRLPELGSALGEGIKNFRKAYRDSKVLDVSTGTQTPTVNDSAGNTEGEKKA